MSQGLKMTWASLRGGDNGDTEVCMRCQWLGLERNEGNFFSVSTMGSLQNIQKALKIKTKVNITSASTI